MSASIPQVRFLPAPLPEQKGLPTVLMKLKKKYTHTGNRGRSIKVTKSGNNAKKYDAPKGMRDRTTKAAAHR